MTILAAITNPGRGTWIGCDTQSKRCDLMLANSRPKWLVRGSVAVGISGIGLAYDVIEAHADTAGLFDPETPAFQFGQQVKKLLQDYGIRVALRSPEDTAETGDIWILRATSDQITSFGTDFGFRTVEPGEFVAEGCGERIAYGAAHASLAINPDISRRRVVEIAVEAAIRYESDCGGEVWTHLLEKKD